MFRQAISAFSIETKYIREGFFQKKLGKEISNNTVEPNLQIF